MPPCPSPDQFQAWLNEEAAPSVALALEAHLDTCPECQARLDQMTSGSVPISFVAPLDNAPTKRDEEFLRGLAKSPIGRSRLEPELTGRNFNTLKGDRISSEPFMPMPLVTGYKVTGVLGQGGMGMVYDATEESLKRRVALKMILPGRLATSHDRARFRIEAEASARLQHPNIVQIYEIGEQEGRPFLALEYVDGGCLAEKLGDDVVPEQQAARLVETLARAIHHAHQHGIIHRDLKPSNILLQGRDVAAGETAAKSHVGRLDEFIPKVTDFGLAKLIIGGADATLTGSIMGTPSYMAPEQAAGRTRDISTAVDTYALGAILYELLTGRPPFRCDSIEETLQQVVNNDPPPPRRFRPGVNGELETICLKCLEKEPGQRYASADELAEDLRRFQNNEPIRARPVSVWKAAWKWARRRPAVAALLVVTMLSAIGLLCGSLLYQHQLGIWLADVGFERDQAQTARTDAEEQRDQAEHNLYLAQIPLAQHAWEAAHVGRLRELLDAVRPRLPNRMDRRNLEWHYLDGLLRTDLRTLSGHTEPVTAVAFRFDGKLLASAGAGGKIRIWDPATGLEVGSQLVKHSGRVTSVAFSPDGKLLASAGEDWKVLLWDAESRKVLRTMTGHKGWVYHVAFSRDGQRLASASADTAVKLWDVATGQEISALRGHTKQATSVAFSPNGEHLASGGADQTVRIWNLNGGKEPRVFRGHKGWVYSVAFSPDGQSLATSESFDKSIRVWDFVSGTQRLEIKKHTGQVRDVAFSPDGSRLASASFDQTVRLWDAKTGDELFCWKGHFGKVNAVAFDPSGKIIASAGEDHKVKLWDATRDQSFLLAQKHADGSVSAVSFSPDGKHLASGGSDALIRIWDMAAGRQLAALAGHKGTVYTLAYSPDGKKLASGGADRLIHIWDAQTLKPLQQLEGHDGRRAACIAFSPDGTQLASAGYDGKVKVWDMSDGRMRWGFTAHSGRALSLAFSPDGRLLASAGEDRIVYIWDAHIGKEVTSIEDHAGWIYCLSFSPNGKSLALGSEDGTIKIHDTDSWSMKLSLDGHAGRVSSIAFSPDGLRLLSAGHGDKTVKVWELTRGQELLSLLHPWPVHAVAVSSDGRFFASAGDNPTVRLWNAAPAQE